MTCSIFIRSYDKDIPWLAYCLRSIQKYASGFEEVVVALPEGLSLPLTQERVVNVPDLQPGYLGQQVSKLQAHRHCSSGYILHIDSDTILTEPVTPESFMVHGKPLWLMTPMEQLKTEGSSAWSEVMLRFTGVTPIYEYMRRQGQMIPRWAYGALEDYCRSRHGKSIEDYVMTQPGHEFSEFNCIGMFLHLEYANWIHFHDTDYGVPPTLMQQHWSWGGLSEDIRKDLEEALA